jgi:hypothetical protein
MLKKVLWIAAACAAVLVALAVSRQLNFDEPAKAPEKSIEVEQVAPEAAPPPPPPPPAPEIQEAPPPLTPEEQQIQDDAAATGMTTMEPESPPTESPNN